MEKSQNDGKNLISLAGEIIAEIIDLLYQHFTLLKKEFSENASKIVKSVILLLAAAIMGYAGLLFLGILAIYALSLVAPFWLALIIVTAIYLGIPLLMFFYAINLLGKVLKEPKKFITELKKTGEETEKWIKNLKK
ncbi:MAG TPA: phage holin family protein [Candidatus Gastranaerophilales bacterium]|nr:phage holin family protein [Candidatus Gastranaerophilales bacterium]